MVGGRHIATIGVFVLVTSMAGCPFPHPAEVEETEDPLAQQNRDIEHYNQTQLELDEARDEFLGEDAGELFPAGNRLYWLEFRNWAPTFHSWDAESDQRVNHGFSVGEGTRYNFRASSEAVAVAEEDFDGIIYHVYDATQEQTEITTVEFPSPSDEQRWWAYDVSGSDLYVITTGEETSLFRTSPGGEPVLVTTLESAGCNVEEFWDFGVSGGTLVFIESGRLWSLDLPSNRATWLENETEISGWVNFTHEGALFEAYDGLYFFDYDTAELLDIAAEIAAAEYQLNETYQSTHLYFEGFSWYRDSLVYIGSGGVFAYNMASRAVTPILLEPRMGDTSDVRIVYRYPVVLDNGLLFVTGLTSESGSVGAEGPVFRVDISNILP